MQTKVFNASPKFMKKIHIHIYVYILTFHLPHPTPTSTHHPSASQQVLDPTLLVYRLSRLAPRHGAEMWHGRNRSPNGSCRSCPCRWRRQRLARRAADKVSAIRLLRNPATPASVTLRQLICHIMVTMVGWLLLHNSRQSVMETV